MDGHDTMGVNSIIRAFDANVDSVNKVDMSMVVRINTSSVDRYSTVIDPGGAKLENYRKNPVVLWEHAKDPRRFTDPIARNQWVRTDGGQRPTSLLAKPQFLQDDFSRQRWEWYRDGVLNAFSVNILPVDGSSSPPTKEETRARPEWESAHTIYREWDLAEYSGTTVPGNADALVADRAAQLLDLVSRSLLWLPDEVKELVEAKARTTTDSMGGGAGGGIAVARRVVEKGGKWYVESEEGKNLGGPYGSKGEAEKRLAQVEHFKHEDDTRGKPVFEIVHNDDGWLIRDSEGVTLAVFDDESMAWKAFEAMQVSRTWRDLHDDMAGAQAKRNAEIATYLADELDLRLKGTV